MKTIRLLIMLVLFSCVFGTIDALAGNVYGTSAVIYDFANNRTRGYSRTQVDYDTAEYYTAYVCGELYKNGVYKVRACQSGIITATIYTQYTGTSGTGSVVSDHYVDMKYFEDEQSSYVDSLGYRFSPGSSYPGDWFFYPADIFGYFNPVSIHLGSTTLTRPQVTIVNNDFNPLSVAINGNPTNQSSGSASISASPPCGDPTCLHTGDLVDVEIIQNTAGGVFTFNPTTQNMEIALILGGATTASFTVIAQSVNANPPPPNPKEFSFTIRISDVRRPDPGGGSTSILANVQISPATNGAAKILKVNHP